MISMFPDVIAVARLEEFRREAEQWRLARQVRASSATTEQTP
jgi:hypothetical protein